MRRFLTALVSTILVTASVLALAGASEVAVLYREVPGVAAGRKTAGTVIWKTESDGTTALVTIPKQQSVSIIFKKNDDKAVPATHLIDIGFTPCAGSVSNIPGILSKPSETARGTPLAGLSVKSGCDHFMIGLSATPEDYERNSELVQRNDWLDIAITYSNGRRGILAIKKGKAGSNAIAALFDGTPAKPDPPEDPCKELPSPRIGMTVDDVLRTCWGTPRRIIKKTTASGVEESYVYSLGHIVKLVDGKVTEITESE